MSDHLQEMLKCAQAVWQHAHSPYSGFSVGCCIRTPDGKYFAGCNVENAVNPISQCAEGGAIGAMVSAGHHEIAEVLIYTESKHACLPCGGCRQQLSEFALPEVKVHSAGPEGVHHSRTMAELLPEAFTKRDLEKFK